MDCLPAWHYQILEVAARSKALGQVKVPGCPQSLGERDTVPCRPEHMRQHVEQVLVAGGWWQGPISMTQYALARNLMSEVGPDATPEEMVAIAEAAVNRQRYQPDKWPTVERQLMKDGEWFGKQRGQNPAASTSQDPYFVHFYVAALVLAGVTGNFTRGANLYFDSVTQNAVRRKCLAQGKTDCATEAHDVLENWTRGGESYWVGPLPGINPRRLLLLVSGRPARAAYKTPEGKERWRQMREASLRAIDSTGPDERRTVYDLPPCGAAGPASPKAIAVAGALAAVVGVGGAAIAALHFARVWRMSKPARLSRAGV